MLKQLRKKENAKRVLWILAIIIVPLFVLWGSVSPMRGQGKINYAGKIFGRKVSFEEFNDCLQAVKTQAVLQFGDNFNKVQKFLNLERETWDRLILLHEARKRKIKITNQEVVEAIKKYPLFQRDAKFDPKIYEDVLMYGLHIPPREFEEQIRLSLMFVKLFEDLTKGVKADDRELAEEYKKANEKVRLSYFLFTPALFEKGISADAPSIKDYYEKHKIEFKKPASINIQYLGVDFTSPTNPEEKRQILEKVGLAATALQKDADFEKVAKHLGLFVKETGFFSPQGPIPAIGWSNEFLETAFNLKPQEISPPLETPKGIYILKLKEKRDSYIPDLVEVESEVKKILIFEKSSELAQAKAKESLEKIRKIQKANKKIDFAKLAKSFEVELKTTPLFKYGEYIPTIGIAKEFQDAAFSLRDSKDKISEVISLPAGFCILKLEENQKIDEKKFGQEKENFKKELLDKKKKEAFNSFFQELKKDARLQDNISKFKP